MKLLERKLYLMLSILFFAMGAFFLFLSIMTGNAPNGTFYAAIVMGIIAFTIYYLYPQIRNKDERFKFIRAKGMFYTYIAFCIYCFILMLLLNLGVIVISALTAVRILLFLTVGTVFLSWIVLSKIY